MNIRLKVSGWKNLKTVKIKSLKYQKQELIQSFAKSGNKYYIAQRRGDDVFVSTCSIDSKNDKILNFDQNSTMRLKGFAHGQTFEFVECDGKMYMLLGTRSERIFRSR